MNTNKIFRVFLWISIGTLIICFGTYFYVGWSIHQIGKFVTSEVQYNLRSPHIYIINRIRERYSFFRDTLNPTPISDVNMSIECYKREKTTRIGKYSDNLVKLMTSDEKFRNAVKGRIIDSVAFIVKTPKHDDIMGSAVLGKRGWIVEFR